MRGAMLGLLLVLAGTTHVRSQDEVTATATATTTTGSKTGTTTTNTARELSPETPIVSEVTCATVPMHEGRPPRGYVRYIALIARRSRSHHRLTTTVVCVCVCACVCMCMRVSVRVRVCVRFFVRVCVRACVRLSFCLSFRSLLV